MKVYKKPLIDLVAFRDADELMETITTSFGGEGTGHEPDTKHQDFSEFSTWNDSDSDSDL